ncbi:MAG: HTH domain-containing protein [Candidatus Aenigmatarchaeota archaeon]|nr:HTH domain-containing protein [Candidatus Aenigmarchaeota archaeon]
MKTVLFYFSKGARTRVKIIKIIDSLNKRNKPVFLNTLSKKLKISHVAVKKHVDLLRELSYIKEINPKGKPIYLRVTQKGKDVAKEFEK